MRIVIFHNPQAVFRAVPPEYIRYTVFVEITDSCNHKTFRFRYLWHPFMRIVIFHNPQAVFRAVPPKYVRYPIPVEISNTCHLKSCRFRYLRHPFVRIIISHNPQTVLYPVPPEYIRYTIPVEITICLFTYVFICRRIYRTIILSNCQCKITSIVWKNIYTT